MIRGIDREYLLIFLMVFLFTALAPPGRENVWGAVVVQPDSIDLGDIGAGKLKKGTVILSSSDTRRKAWSAELGEGWLCKSGQTLTGIMDPSRTLTIKFAMKSLLIPSGDNSNGLYTVVLNMESDNRQVVYNKKFTSGHHREGIVLNVGGEITIIEMAFNITEYPMEPVLCVSPRRLDFGTLGQGQKTTRKIEITNRGRQALKWKVNQKNRLQQPADADHLKGRYISFQQSHQRGTGQYRTGNEEKDSAEFTGHWAEVDGYPEAQQSGTLKYRFAGSGAIIYFWKSPAARMLDVYLDNRLITRIDAYNEQTVPAEYRINDVLGAGLHTLSLINVQGRIVLEGIMINGKTVSRGNGKWINIFPETGFTTREIDYLHVSLDTTRLPPGTYGHVLNVESNGGDVSIEVYAEVSMENGSKIIDVYRYGYGNDILLSSDLQAEVRTAYFRDYRKQGIAFRLFSHGTPGTTEFYRWYSPQRRSHFYSYDTNGEGKISREYIFEGSIGNIATIRLPNTRELYRWQHPSTGQFFFSTDPKGEGVNKKGYKYNGIAGYVR